MSKSESLVPRRGSPSSRASFVALATLSGVEWQIRLRWDVPVWSIFASLFLTIALWVQVVVNRSQEPPRAIRPLTLTSVAVAVICTVLVLLSDTPSDKWFLLAWLVPSTTALAEKIWPHLPNPTLVRIVSCLLAVVIVGQLWFVWRAHTRHERVSSFQNRLAQICTDTAALRSSSGTPTWVAANEWMIAQIETLTPPDERTRKLTGYLIADLQNSETSLKVNDPVTQGQWQQLARKVAGYLDVNHSCGVF